MGPAGHGTSDADQGMGLGPGAGPGTRDWDQGPGPGTRAWDQGQGTRDRGPPKDQGPGTKDQGPGTPKGPGTRDHHNVGALGAIRDTRATLSNQRHAGDPKPVLPAVAVVSRAVAVHDLGAGSSSGRWRIG